MSEKWSITIQGLEADGPSGNTTDVSSIRSAVSEMIGQVAFHSNLDGYGDDYMVVAEITRSD